MKKRTNTPSPKTKSTKSDEIEAQLRQMESDWLAAKTKMFDDYLRPKYNIRLVSKSGKSSHFKLP